MRVTYITDISISHIKGSSNPFFKTRVSKRRTTSLTAAPTKHEEDKRSYNERAKQKYRESLLSNFRNLPAELLADLNNKTLLFFINRNQGDVTWQELIEIAKGGKWRHTLGMGRATRNNLRKVIIKHLPTIGS